MVFSLLGMGDGNAKQTSTPCGGLASFLRILLALLGFQSRFSLRSPPHAAEFRCGVFESQFSSIWGSDSIIARTVKRCKHRNAASCQSANDSARARNAGSHTYPRLKSLERKAVTPTKSSSAGCFAGKPPVWDIIAKKIRGNE